MFTSEFQLHTYAFGPGPVFFSWNILWHRWLARACSNGKDGLNGNRLWNLYQHLLEFISINASFSEPMIQFKLAQN